MNTYLINLARTDEEKRLLARLDDLVQKAVQGIGGRSDFMDLRQQALAQAAATNAAGIIWHLEGGYEQAERRRLLVSPEWGSEVAARISYLRITTHEFQASPPGHRDYLGAVLNLGIRREKLGDIVLQNLDAVLIVADDLADFISMHLTQVKNSRVEAEKIRPEDFVFQPPELQAIKLNLASLRLDAAVAAVFKLSRGQANDLVESGVVRLNQLQIYKGSAALQPGDLISVRGQGRFRLEEIGTMSRKGRQWVLISRW